MTVVVMELLVVMNGFHLVYLSPWNMVLLYIFAAFTLFAGFWGTLQFSSLIHRFPVVLINTERLMMAVYPLIFYMVLIWGLLGLVGPEAAPFYLIAVSVIFYRAYATPIASSFRFPIKGASQAHEYSFEAGFILSAPELLSQFLTYALSPALTFATLNRTVLFMGDPRALSALMLLLSFPTLLMVVHSPKEWLWWSGFSEDRLSSFKRTLTLLSLAVAVGVFEYRVLFLSYGSYIIFPWPANVIAVTVSLYSFAFLGLGLYTGAVRMVGYSVAMPLALVASAAAALALGLPLPVMGLLLASAAAFVHFYFTLRPEAHLAFVCCTSLLALYFLRENFFFLDFTFAEYHTSLKVTAMLVLILLITSLAVVPVAFLDMSHLVLTAVIQPLLLLQALVLAFLEQVLYEQLEDMYPGYLVILTSVVGIMVTFE